MVRVAIKRSLIFQSPSVGSPLVRESGNVLHVESWILEIFACVIRNPGLGIRNIAIGIPNPTNNWNPESKFHWKIGNPRRGVQSWIPLHCASRGRCSTGLTYFSSKKKLELNTVKEYNLDIAKARLRLYSVNP